MSGSRFDTLTMPWLRASLRGQKVYARATASGELAAVRDRVEIRYNANDGRRYDASTRNLTVVDAALLPDDACGEAERTEPAKPAATRVAGAKAAGGRSGSSGASARRKAEAAAAAPTGPAAGELCVYTDGACTGNPGPAGLGVVVLGDSGRKELSEYLGAGTNNIAELTAIERALDMTEGRSEPVRIHTDSQYAIGVLTKGWKAKANRELIEGIREKLKDRSRVSIQYVPGHSGVPLNERADELAREAIKTRQTRTESL